MFAVTIGSCAGGSSWVGVVMMGGGGGVAATPARCSPLLLNRCLHGRTAPRLYAIARRAQSGKNEKCGGRARTTHVRRRANSRIQVQCLTSTALNRPLQAWHIAPSPAPNRPAHPWHTSTAPPPALNRHAHPWHTAPSPAVPTCWR